MQTDADVVRAVLNGQRQAFAVLVKRYERSVRAVAMNVLRDHESVQDTAQEAFIKAYENLPGLRRPHAFGPWLMRITHRCALSRASRQPRETALEPTDAAAVRDADGRLDEEKQNLLAAVLKLPEGERQVVMLRYFCGHSVREVAEMLSRSVGTVTKQLSRAHKRLRNILKEPEK
ncbi:MAG TPA: sigma-70 family RNA polymerase sigma factor [Sedimentisphaerales bacterium]|nr:sigma-70 family RNA polymerase sigma factor [Sedimentisphaerales bacterium]